MDTPHEQEILSLALNGNLNSFEELLSINFIKSKSIIQKHFKISKDDLNDIMQNTSIKVWQHFKEHSSYDNFYNWFFTVFKNEAVRFLKQRNKIELNELSNIVLDFDSFDTEDSKVYLKTLDFILQDTARTFLERKERINQYEKVIENLLNKLSPNHKEIIEKILIDGKSYKDVAKELNLPVGSIMSRLYYAKQESRKIINEYSKIHNIEINIAA